MLRFPRRLERERKTLIAMIDLYYSSPQVGEDPEKQQLISYALARLAACPFGNQKPTCAQCPVHCYCPDMRERIRKVMRYAGPRMIFHHPILSILHLRDRFRYKPCDA